MTTGTHGVRRHRAGPFRFRFSAVFGRPRTPRGLQAGGHRFDPGTLHHPQSFGQHEGLPLPPAEATVCGASSSVTTALGPRVFSSRIRISGPRGDFMVFAQTLERVLSLQRDDPGRLRHRAKQAADFIAQNYLPAREEDELLAACVEILAPRQK